jgi:hypothetical protein
MDLSSFQRDAWPNGRPALDAIKADHALSPRAARLLRDLTLLLAIVVLLFGLRPIANAVKRERDRPAPLPFHVVMQRFDEVQLQSPRSQVEERLGQPNCVEDLRLMPELQEHMKRVEHSYRGLRIEGEWWGNPKDPDKWAFIYFFDDKVVYMDKHGF